MSSIAFDIKLFISNLFQMTHPDSDEPDLPLQLHTIQAFKGTLPDLFFGIG
jgi:hypothetical protein